MRVLTPHLISDKTVLLRVDMDVPIGFDKDENGKVKRVVLEDFRLRACLPTLYLCLQYAKKVIVMGHIGRPDGKEDKALSVAPIVDWFDANIPSFDFPPEKFLVLENLRFESGEDNCDPNYAKELASLGDFFVNEAFAAHHAASSTTLLPALLPSAVGFHFDHEVRVLKELRTNPKEPFVAIIGGAKIEDKLPAISSMARVAHKVLVGGKLPSEIRSQGTQLPANVIVADMDSTGFDISSESIAQFSHELVGAKQVVWSGPMGKFEDGYNKGDLALAKAAIASNADSTIGGGDTITALSKLDLIEQFSFVSTGGGAMLEYLAHGTLPTIEAIKN